MAETAPEIKLLPDNGMRAAAPAKLKPDPRPFEKGWAPPPIKVEEKVKPPVGGFTKEEEG